MLSEKKVLGIKLDKKGRLILVAATFLVLISLFLRFQIFKIEGGDHPVYKKAVLDLSAGKNPYKYTSISYEIKKLDKGYAYPPTILYILTTMWQFNVITDADIATAILWKVPVLFADLGIAYMLYKYFHKKDRPWLGIISAAIWLLNPYFLIRYEYSFLDPFQILFVFLALNTLGKRPYRTGALYALAVSTKIVPIILIPIFFFKTKNKYKMAASFLVTFFVISLPFITNIQDLYYYLQGTLLVHQDRVIQGRPILSFITYFTQNKGITFYQEIYPGIFSKLALITGPLISTYLILKGKLNDKYVLTAISFASYILFTPVFNRTHILWGLPFFIIAIYFFTKHKSELKTYIYLAVFYLAISLYMFFWNEGLKPPDIEHSGIWLSDSKSIEFDWPLKEFYKLKYYEYRGKYFK